MLSYDLRDNSKKRGCLIVGNMIVNCCARVPLESEQLAYIVAEHLSVLRDMLHRWGFFDIGRNISIGSPSAPGSIIQNDSADEWFVTTMTSPFQLNRMSKTLPLEKPMVSAIETRMNGQLTPISSSAVPYTSSGNLPYNVAKDYQTSSELREGPIADDIQTLPHPLNPAVRVTIRPVRAGDPAIRPPSLRGRAIPIIRVPVEESDEQLRLQERVIKT